MTRDEAVAINPGFALAFVQHTAPIDRKQTNQFLLALLIQAGLPEA